MHKEVYNVIFFLIPLCFSLCRMEGPSTSSGVDPQLESLLNMFPGKSESLIKKLLKVKGLEETVEVLLSVHEHQGLGDSECEKKHEPSAEADVAVSDDEDEDKELLAVDISRWTGAMLQSAEVLAQVPSSHSARMGSDSAGREQLSTMSLGQQRHQDRTFPRSSSTATSQSGGPQHQKNSVNLKAPSSGRPAAGTDMGAKTSPTAVLEMNFTDEEGSPTEAYTYGQHAAAPITLDSDSESEGLASLKEQEASCWPVHTSASAASLEECKGANKKLDRVEREGKSEHSGWVSSHPISGVDLEQWGLWTQLPPQGMSSLKGRAEPAMLAKECARGSAGADDPRGAPMGAQASGQAGLRTGAGGGPTDKSVIEAYNGASALRPRFSSLYGNEFWNEDIAAGKHGDDMPAGTIGGDEGCLVTLKDKETTSCQLSGLPRNMSRQQKRKNVIDDTHAAEGSRQPVDGSTWKESNCESIPGQHDVRSFQRICNPILGINSIASIDAETGLYPENDDKKSKPAAKKRKVLSEEEKTKKADERAAKKAESARKKEEEKAAKMAAANQQKQEKASEKLQKEEEEKKKKELAKEEDKLRKGTDCTMRNKTCIDRCLINKAYTPSVTKGLIDKDYEYDVMDNPVKGSILWKLEKHVLDSQQGSSQGLDFDSQDSWPSQNSQVPTVREELEYVLIVVEAKSFIEWVLQDSLDGHILSARDTHPTYTICFLILGLQRLLRNEKKQYDHPTGTAYDPTTSVGKRCLHALARMATHYDKVHSRLCSNEYELAEHVVGLHRTLAEACYRPKLSMYQITQNGGTVNKSDHLSVIIRDNVWMKMLVGIPGVACRDALAIAAKYPTMGSLLRAYTAEPTVKGKEGLLEGLSRQVDGEVHTTRARIGIDTSKKVYRLLTQRDPTLFLKDIVAKNFQEAPSQHQATPDGL